MVTLLHYKKIDADVNKKTKNEKLYMTGITQNKQRCLIFHRGPFKEKK